MQNPYRTDPIPDPVTRQRHIGLLLFDGSRSWTRSVGGRALHLVARLAGSDRARAVRRGIQYDPHPPV